MKGREKAEEKGGGGKEQKEERGSKGISCAIVFEIYPEVKRKRLWAVFIRHPQHLNALVALTSPLPKKHMAHITQRCSRLKIMPRGGSLTNFDCQRSRGISSLLRNNPRPLPMFSCTRQPCQLSPERTYVEHRSQEYCALKSDTVKIVGTQASPKHRSFQLLREWIQKLPRSLLWALIPHFCGDGKIDPWGLSTASFEKN